MVNFSPEYNPCDQTSAGGVNFIYLKPRSEIGRFWYYTQTNPLQYGEITGHSGANNQWYSLANSPADTNFTENLDTAIPRGYTQIFRTKVYPSEALSRDYIERMLVAQDLVIIYQDFNGRWWVVGETNGCRLTEYGMTTDVEKGQNTYTIAFSARERYPIREISQTYIDDYVQVNPPFICPDECDNIESLCGYNIEQLCCIELT